MRFRAIAALLGGLLLGVLAPPAAPAGGSPLRRGDFFGMVTHYWGDAMPQRMRELGANWVRVGCAWFEVQPAPNPDPATWNWACPDRAMSATAQGFHVLYDLGYAPAWVNGGRGFEYPPTPGRLGDWYHYCAEVMRRYAGRGVVYSVWNEPNLDVFFMGSFDDYANLVRYASQAVRSVDPGARLSGPETSSLDTRGRESWHRDAVSVLGGMFDIVTTHWYCGSRCAPTAEGVALQVSAYVAGRTAALPAGVPLWLTETGFESWDDARQAAFYDGVLRAYHDNFRNAARRATPAWQNLFFYHLLAPDGATIVRLDDARTPRPAFDSYRSWILGSPYAVPR